MERQLVDHRKKGGGFLPTSPCASVVSSRSGVGRWRAQATPHLTPQQPSHPQDDVRRRCSGNSS